MTRSLIKCIPEVFVATTVDTLFLTGNFFIQDFLYLCILNLTNMKRIYKVTLYSGGKEDIYYLKGTLQIDSVSGVYRITTAEEELFFPIGRTLVRCTDLEDYKWRKY